MHQHLQVFPNNPRSISIVVPMPHETCSVMMASSVQSRRISEHALECRPHLGLRTEKAWDEYNRVAANEFIRYPPKRLLCRLDGQSNTTWQQPCQSPCMYHMLAQSTWAGFHLGKFSLTSFTSSCGQSNMPSFSLTSLLVEKLACQLFNK